MAARSCMLAARVGRPAECDPACPFWQPGGTAVPAGCALERILPAEDWPAELAERWLRVRAAAEARSGSEGTSLFGSPDDPPLHRICTTSS